jgi:hypothetical protein
MLCPCGLGVVSPPLSLHGGTANQIDGFAPLLHVGEPDSPAIQDPSTRESPDPTAPSFCDHLVVRQVPSAPS